MVPMQKPQYTLCHPFFPELAKTLGIKHSNGKSLSNEGFNGKIYKWMIFIAMFD